MVSSLYAGASLENFLLRVAPSNEELPEIIYGNRWKEIYENHGEGLKDFLRSSPAYEEHSFKDNFEVVQAGIQQLAHQYAGRAIWSGNEQNHQRSIDEIVEEADARIERYGDDWGEKEIANYLEMEKDIIMSERLYDQDYFHLEGDFGYLESEGYDYHSLYKLTTQFERDVAEVLIADFENDGISDYWLAEDPLNQPLDKHEAELLWQFAILGDPSVKLEDIEGKTLNELENQGWDFDDYFLGYDFSKVADSAGLNLDEVEQLYLEGYEFYEVRPRGFVNEYDLYAIHPDDKKSKKEYLSHGDDPNVVVRQLTPSGFAGRGGSNHNLIVYEGLLKSAKKSSIVVEAEQKLGVDWKKEPRLNEPIQQHNRGLKL